MKAIRNKGILFGFVINGLIIAGLGWISISRYRLIEDIQKLQNTRNEIAYLLQNTIATINGIGNQAKGFAFTGQGSYLLDLNQDLITSNIRKLEYLCIAGPKQAERLKELEQLTKEQIKLNFEIIEAARKKTLSDSVLGNYGVLNSQLIFKTYQVTGEIREDENTSFQVAISDKMNKQRLLEILGWIFLFTAIALLFVVYFIINFYLKIRKETEQSLLQSRSLLQSVIDNSSNPVFIKQLNGQYLLVNRRFERLINEDAIVGKTDYELLPHEMADRMRSSDLEIIKNGKDLRFEESFPHTGEKHTFLMVKFPIRDTKNKIYAVGCIATDITEHKVRDQQLRESEAQITTIFNSGPDAIIAINEEGNVVRWNPKATELFKYSENEVMGKPMHEFIMPERFHEAHMRGIKHFIKTGEGPILNKSIEVSAHDKNGREFEIELTVSFSRLSEKFIFIAFAREITNRKKLERDVLEYKNFLFSVIQNIPDLVYVKDAKSLNYVLINPAGERFFGIPRTQIIGKSNYELTTKSEADALKAQDMEAVKKGELFEIPEESVNTKFGKRWLQTKKIPIMDETGKPKFLLGISRDITEQKKLESERNKAEKQLRENEERMAMILENIGEGVVVANPDNKIVLSNLMAEDIFETDQVRSIDWSEEWDIYYPDGKTIFPAQNLPLERALRGEISDMEIVLENPDTKKKKLLQVTGRPIRNEKGAVVAAVATIKDVTRFKKLEKALEESRKLIGFGRARYEELEKEMEKGNELKTEEIKEDGKQNEELNKQDKEKKELEKNKTDEFTIHKLPPAPPEK